MAIAQVQKQRAQTNGSSTTATFSSTATLGNTLVAAAFTNGNQSSLDISGWTLARKTNYSGTAASVGIWYKVSDGTETSVTSTGNTICRLHIAEFSGILVPELDQTNSNTMNTVTSINTGSITTTAAEELIITAASNVASSAGTRSWSDSFSVLYDDATGPRLLSGYRIVSSTGTYSSTATLHTSNSNSGAVIASFKAASSPTGNSSNFFFY